jgi:RNA polymerase sigma-70 factor (ECF subfamily)
LLPIDEKLVARLHRRANGERWNVSPSAFAEALAASAARALLDRNPAPREVERYLESLRLEDLALACACAAGNEQAWEHFIREHRPGMYRAADALDPSGGARDIADAMYADLFGLRDRDGERQSLFRYYHGRSSLGTWLRAVLAQRHVDRLRSARREDPLPEDDSAAAVPSQPARAETDPDRQRYLAAMGRALGRAIAGLAPRDRLRLRCYYAQGLTLAQTGRLLGEHEATASRQLARARSEIRREVERRLRQDAGLTDDQIGRCLESVLEDPGPLDLDTLVPGETVTARKESRPDRSKVENEGTP